MEKLDPSNKSYKIQSSLEIAPFNRYVEVYGLKIAGLKETGGNVAVEDEFKERYGINVSNAKYEETLYLNVLVLGRDYDQDGYNYWLGYLNAGKETKYELLLGFAESAENKALFSEITGFS